MVSWAAGGYFIGTVPDGKRVKGHLVKKQGEVEHGALLLKQKWEVSGNQQQLQQRVVQQSLGCTAACAIDVLGIQAALCESCCSFAWAGG